MADQPSRWFAVPKWAIKSLKQHRAPCSVQQLYVNLCILDNERCSREEHPEPWFIMSDKRVAEFSGMRERTVKYAKPFLIQWGLVKAETVGWQDRGARMPDRLVVTRWRIIK